MDLFVVLLDLQYQSFWARLVIHRFFFTLMIFYIVEQYREHQNYEMTWNYMVNKEMLEKQDTFHSLDSSE